MEEFYYGDIYSIASNDISDIAKGNVFWVQDGSVSVHHPYIIANAYSHDKVPIIYAFCIDSKPYVSNMVPITMNGTISYINPFRLVQLSVRDFSKKNLHGSLVDMQALDIAYKIYSLQFYVRGFDDKKICEEYAAYLHKFFVTNSNVPEYVRKTTNFDDSTSDRKLKFTTTIIDFDIDKYIKPEEDDIFSRLSIKVVEDNRNVTKSDIIEYYEKLIDTTTNASSFIVDNMSIDEIKLFLGLFDHMKKSEIAQLTGMSQPTVYRRRQQMIDKLGGDVTVIDDSEEM